MDSWTYYITWNTYGTWLPGDARGWRKRGCGQQTPRPLLENWCSEQMRFDPVLLSERDRATVEAACHAHCLIRGWTVLSVKRRRSADDDLNNCLLLLATFAISPAL